MVHGTERKTQPPTTLPLASFYWVFSAPVTTMEKQDVLAGFTYGSQNGVGLIGQMKLTLSFHSGM